MHIILGIHFRNIKPTQTKKYLVNIFLVVAVVVAKVSLLHK